jgi:hypothetical protein
MHSNFIFYEDKENWMEMALAKIKIKETEHIREKGNGLLRCCYFNSGTRNINLQQKEPVVVEYF